MQILENGKWITLTWQEEYAREAQNKGWKQLIPLEEKYPNEEKRLDILVNKMLFDNGPEDFTKIMWRMSNGSRTKAFELAQRIVGFSYGLEINEEDFDWACAMITDGYEVEWLED